MSELLSRIRQAQVEAGEAVVIEHLRSRGLLPTVAAGSNEREIGDAAKGVAALEGAIISLPETDSGHD